MSLTETPAQQTTVPSVPRRVVGMLAVAAALAVSELVAGLLASVPSLVEGIATFVIDNVPPAIKELAIELFGTADKLVLAIGIIVVALAIGGLVGARSRVTRVAVFGAFGVVAALAAARSPQVDLAPALLNGAISAGAGIGTDAALRSGRPDQDPSRRAFLAKAGGLTAFVLVAAAGGRYLAEKTRVMLARRDEVVLPVPVDAVAPVAPAQQLAVEGISPIVTPNDVFYRIDTAPLNPPQVDLAAWQVSVTGLVDREVTLSYTDLLDMELVERYVTISCVSNEVGGGLVGNARWLGVPLREILDRAGVGADAEQIVAESVDGFTVGFPVEAAYDGREALLAVGMNGEPLPFEHGFPARLVVAGLYGYVSATKWLSQIRLTRWDEFDAYWIPRGWAKEAPVKTQSRIDTPRDGASIPTGARAIAGVAWAPTRDISRVEVNVDDAGWVEATLSEPLSESSWVQWNVPWDATSGRHRISVRATDGTGETQTAERTPVAPDGATGHHTITVDVG